MAEKIGPMVKDRAFLIRSVDYGEGHRILHWLSEEHGRVHLMAFSARKSRSRSFQSIDYLQNYRIEYQARGNLGQLVQCEVLESFEGLRFHYDKAVTALGWMKILTKALHEGLNIQGVYALVRECLACLERRDEKAMDLIYRYQLLARLGYRLELSRCARCGRRDGASFEFSATEGGLRCQDCGSRGAGAVVLPQAIPDEYWSLETEIPWGETALQARVSRLLRQAFMDLMGFGPD